MDFINKITLTACLLMMVACNSNRETVTVAPDSDSTPVHAIGVGPKAAVMPKAVVYKTNGDYADHVMVTLNDARTALTSFPDPVDVSAHSMPIDLGDGWLLDRRGGIGANSAFLTYTYTEYAALPKVPKTSELMQSIIPGARITEYRVLPITVNKAISDLDAVRKYLDD